MLALFNNDGVDTTKYALKYISFGAFLIFAATGLAISYSGCSLMMLYVAYLSPWIPTWLWIAVSIVMVTGVFITAVGTSGAIGTMADKGKLRNMCILLVFIVLFGEMSTQVFSYTKGHIFVDSLRSYMKFSMVNSQSSYSNNISDTQMWDEIQFEMNCCGVQTYKDWYRTDFGEGTNIPDTCCLLVTPGCGQNASSVVDPEDDFVTQGCLPTLLKGIQSDIQMLTTTVWLPTVVIQIIVALILVYSFVEESRRVFAYKNNILQAVTMIPNSNTDYNKLEVSEKA